MQNPGFKVQDLNFYCKRLKKKKEKEKIGRGAVVARTKGRKTQQSCREMVIICELTCCIIWELNPASCDGAYALSSARGFITNFQNI
jgi:hypothetical protein